MSSRVSTPHAIAKKAVLCLLALVTACSHATSRTGSVAAAGGQTGANASPAAGSTSSATSGAPSSSDSLAVGASPTPSGTNVVVFDDVISAQVNKYVSWGCSFRSGDHCIIPFQGGYYLRSTRKGILVFAAFENGSKTPASKQSVPATPGYAPFQAKFAYTVGLTAKTVVFQAFLETTDGRILASGKPHPYPVNP